MIPPREQWCQQIEVTNYCHRACSNCTRLVGHGPLFRMSLDKVAEAMDALADFPIKSPPSEASPHKLVGIMGGEPLLHPKFAEICGLMTRKIPREHRGLWTGTRWQESRYASLIRETFIEQLIHNNLHEAPSHHSPVLVAIEDAMPDSAERQRAIANCWIQRTWAGSVTPRGYFFCEVAGALDWAFGSDGGMPVEPGCWNRPLEEYRPQIDRWCRRCGIPLNLKGRPDKDELDDISESNLRDLGMSPRVMAGRYVLYNPKDHETDERPWEYRK